MSGREDTPRTGEDTPRTGEDTPRTDGGARGGGEREPAARALERRYRWLLSWYPRAYREANEDELLGVALARSEAGQRWPELGEAVNLVASGTGERFAGLLRRHDQRDTAAVLAVVGPILLAAAAVRALMPPLQELPPNLFRLAHLGASDVAPQRMPAVALALAAWWVLVALTGMLRWRRSVAIGACLGLAGQVALLAFAVSAGDGALMVLWEVVVALVTAASALGSLRGEERPLSWWAVLPLTAAAVILAGWPAVEARAVRYTSVTANSGRISDSLSGNEGWLSDGLFAVILVLLVAAIVALRPAVRRRALVLLLPAFVTTALACWGFRGWAPSGTPFGPLMLSPLQWHLLVLVPAIGVAACFTGLRVYERWLRRRALRPQEQGLYHEHLS
jgi:hypothetical protein